MNELIGKEVKIVYENEGDIRALRGVLERIDSQFVYVGRRAGDIMISTKTILQIKPDFGVRRKENGRSG